MKRILVPGRNCEGLYSVHQSGLLVDGRNYYRAFYEAARSAKKYILMAGWQFERSVPLLRGKDRQGGDEVRLVPFLNGLCEKNRELEVFLLMWDFSAVVGLDKEWFNKWIVDLMTGERVHFRFDSRHALGASHHQKLVVIDGKIAFVGGLDICANSWDDRRHWDENAERVIAGEQYEPYHDIQSFHTGPVAWELARVFERRWVHAGGQELSLRPEPGTDIPNIRHRIPIAADRVAISITRAQTLTPLVEPVRHIRQLYCDAIAAAEQLIYIENQYFSSQAVYQALQERMTDIGRPCPQIVLILPKRLHSLVEDVSLSAIQAKMLRSLTEIAARHNRAFGVYYTAAAPKDGGPERATYIHSKLLLVDDRFLSVGSANTTNRSMGMDTELNVSWETSSEGQHHLIRSIRRVRANLLAEHTGLWKLSQRRALGSPDGLVDYLNSNADRQGCRLRRHTMESFLEDISWIKDLMPGDLAIDPERPVIEESIYEIISRDKDGIFAKGILLLNELTVPGAVEPFESREDAAEPLKPSPRPHLGNRGRLRWYFIAAIGIVVAAAVLWLLI
jgi:phosphatidylserine/phosphatidylglycerophosphate/cardiolipin synthase-like enzyme